ncbi:NAD(P)/FAD-dependent oxidoreductase [Streptomyces sp. NPDC093252]|uniref:flavin-containing monooxygenase n=1 Tax=Streptomyces sp. NPDC093252 TaxID=3154980 RepID=UPI00342900EC
MTTSEETSLPAADHATDEERVEVDAVILGAGVAGLHQLHLLRRRGLRVLVFDKAGDVGGTWWWNRYPGARFDSESHVYQYMFDEELYKGWNWTERFPGQPEIQRWTRYVADRLDLRGHIRFSTTITSAVFDEDRSRWTVRTDRGDIVDTQFFVSCAGPLSAPLDHVFEGQNSFSGDILHTAKWPAEGADLTGKRIGVVGTGATGIQVIQTIAGRGRHLTVFARTPQYVIPMKNRVYGEEQQTAYKARFDEVSSAVRQTFAGFDFDFAHVWAEYTPQRRREVLEELYADGSLRLWVGGFADLFFQREVNDEISEFVRNKMRARLGDDRLADILVPSDYGFGTRRVPLEDNYLEVYHRPDVELVSIRDNPIARIVPEGIVLSDGTVHELDIIVLATGFDAATGSLTRIDVRGRDNRSLAEDWGRDIHTLMGLGIHGYPNLFTIGAPLAPSAALCNMPTCTQQQAEWISDAITHVRTQGAATIEATKEAEDAWIEHHEQTAAATLIPSTDSWYTGSNVTGKPRRFLSYTGGAGAYRQKCHEVATSGYPGFTIT